MSGKPLLHAPTPGTLLEKCRQLLLAEFHLGNKPKDWLEDLPPASRPKMIPLFPEGFIYFRRWKSLRWWLLTMAPIVASAASAFYRRSLMGGSMVLVIGFAFGTAGFLTLCMGRSSSNWGTYFRSREPARYSADILIVFAGYLAMAVAGWIV
jgi:hypothetical protein